MKIISLKKYIILWVLFFLSLTAVTYALGTWDSWYKANNGSTTTADSNGSSWNTTLLFSAIEVINNYGSAMFVPTKTAVEWISMWQNNPANVNLRTTREDIAIHRVDTQVSRWIVNNESHCDTIWFKLTNSNSPGTWVDFSNRYYQIIKINSPWVIEWYLNFRLEYGPQVGEILRVFVPIFGQAVPTETHMHEIYKDSWSGANPPDLNIDNSGWNDIQILTLSDPYNGADSYRDVKLTTLVKLRAWDNYIRLEWWKINTNTFACQTWLYSEPAFSIWMEPGQWQVWFTNY
jgi:hypothetical protein